MSFSLNIMCTYHLYIANFKESHTPITRYKLLNIYLWLEILPTPSAKRGCV